MSIFKNAASTALIASTLALAGCAYDNGYGYGGMSVGYGSAGYYDYAPYGWYDGFYYPGSGYWLYDRGGRKHRWGDNHRHYWEQRRAQMGNNWRGPATQPWRRGLRDDNRGDGRGWRRDNRPEGATATPQREWRGRREGLSSEAIQQRRQAREARQNQVREWRGRREGPRNEAIQQRQQAREAVRSLPRAENPAGASRQGRGGWRDRRGD